MSGGRSAGAPPPAPAAPPVPWPGVAFDYTARDRRGAVVTGSLTAESRAAAVAGLKERGLTPTAVSRVAGSGAGPAGTATGGRRRPAPAELALTCRQLAALLDAGVPLPAALLAAGEQAPNAAVRRVLTEAGAAVSGGTPLAAALGRHPRVVPPVVLAALTAGEAGAVLVPVLRALAEALTAEARLQGLAAAARRPARRALLAAVVGAAAAVGLRAAAAAAAGPGVLPPASADGLVRTGVATVLLLAVLGAGLGLLGRLPGRVAGGLRLPRVRAADRGVAVATMAVTLCCLLRCGVPLLHSLHLAAGAGDRGPDGAALRAAVGHLQDNARRGDPLGVGLVHHPVVPPVLAALLLPRSTAVLQQNVATVADLAELEARARAAALRAVLAPLAVLLYAATATWVAAVLVLPLARALGSAG